MERNQLGLDRKQKTTVPRHLFFGRGVHFLWTPVRFFWTPDKADEGKRDECAGLEEGVEEEVEEGGFTS